MFSQGGELCGEQVRCASYRIYARNRRTGQVVEGCDFTEQAAEGKFRRKRQSAADPLASTAELDIDIGGVDPDCCECFPVPWRDELVVERLDRNGQFEAVAWVGPIWDVIDDSVFGMLRVKARDRSVWSMERRTFLRRPIKLDNVDETDVWMAVWADLEADDPSGLVPRPVPTGNIVSVDFPAFQNVADIWGELPGVFWSVVGEELYGPGPVDLGFGDEPVATLDVAAHWDEAGAVVDSSGLNTATCIYVTNAAQAGADGNARGEDGRFQSQTPTNLEGEPAAKVEGWWPNPCTPHPDYGLHTRLVVTGDVSTDAEAVAEARRIWIEDHDGDQFLVTSAGSLAQDAPVSLCDLIVGRVFLAVSDVSCVELEQLLRLNNVVVDFQAEETGRGVQLVESRVAVDLQPLSGERTSNDRQSI